MNTELIAVYERRIADAARNGLRLTLADFDSNRYAETCVRESLAAEAAEKERSRLGEVALRIGALDGAMLVWRGGTPIRELEPPSPRGAWTGALDVTTEWSIGQRLWAPARAHEIVPGTNSTYLALAIRRGYLSSLDVEFDAPSELRMTTVGLRALAGSLAGKTYGYGYAHRDTAVAVAREAFATVGDVAMVAAVAAHIAAAFAAASDLTRRPRAGEVRDDTVKTTVSDWYELRRPA